MVCVAPSRCTEPRQSLQRILQRIEIVGLEAQMNAQVGRRCARAPERRLQRPPPARRAQPRSQDKVTPRYAGDAAAINCAAESRSARPTGRSTPGRGCNWRSCASPWMSTSPGRTSSGCVEAGRVGRHRLGHHTVRQRQHASTHRAVRRTVPPFSTQFMPSGSTTIASHPRHRPRWFNPPAGQPDRHSMIPRREPGATAIAATDPPSGVGSRAVMREDCRR